MRTKRLTIQQRQEIFQDLVATQDSMAVMSVAQSYQDVMQKFGITDEQLHKIEDEGIDKEWPPLSEAVQEVTS